MRCASSRPSHVAGSAAGRRSVWMRRARSISAATLSCALRSSSCSFVDVDELRLERVSLGVERDAVARPAHVDLVGVVDEYDRRQGQDQSGDPRAGRRARPRRGRRWPRPGSRAAPIGSSGATRREARRRCSARPRRPARRCWPGSRRRWPRKAGTTCSTKAAALGHEGEVDESGHERRDARSWRR